MYTWLHIYVYICICVYMCVYIVKRLRDTAAQEILVELLQAFRWHGLRQNFDKIL